MRKLTSSLCSLLVGVVLSGTPLPAHAQAAAAQGAPSPREVDPGVFNTSPLIDRAELRAGRLDIRPGGTRRVHQHDDVQFHLFILLTGTVQLTIGAQTIDAVPGQVYFIARGTPHGFRNASGADATAVEVFVKPPSAAASGDGLATALEALRASIP